MEFSTDDLIPHNRGIVFVKSVANRSMRCQNANVLLKKEWYEFGIFTKQTKYYYHGQSTLYHRGDPPDWLGTGIFRLQRRVCYSSSPRYRDNRYCLPSDTR
jgi:hypothetical protein